MATNASQRTAKNRPIRPTNQKVAGSSPAERAAKYLQMLCFCLMIFTRRSARTTHLTTYLFRNGLPGAFRSDLFSLDSDARNVAWVDVHWCSDWPHAKSYESNKTLDVAFPRSLRDLSAASDSLAGELGDLTSPAKAAAHSPMSFSSIRWTI
jgi:hypothetical protein